MAKEKKQQVRLIFKLAAFGAFILLGYLGLRSYKESVEKLRINGCIEEIGEIAISVQERFGGQHDYKDLDYKSAEKLSIFPKRMKKEGYREMVNSYFGGVDLFYSSLSEKSPSSAFEVSFQGLSSYGCKALIKMNWDTIMQGNLIAVAGYSNAVPSGVLDEVYPETKQEDINVRNIFKGNVARFVGDEKLDYACGCKDNTCTIVWKFR